MDRKIKIEAVDPTGISVGVSEELDYNRLGYSETERLPEEYPIGIFGIQEEPMKHMRYKLIVGDYQYYIDRKGRIFDCLNSKDFSISYNNINE